MHSALASKSHAAGSLVGKGLKASLGAFVCCAILLVSSNVTRAATLSLVSSSGSTISVGQLFSVNAVVSTASGEAMNAVSGTVSFSPSALQLVSIDKAGSIVNFWIGEPSVSNASGQAGFEGGVYNPGFSGANGKVVTLLFRAKTAGTVDISFLDAAILANDGRGTNILTHAKPLALTISPTTQVPVEQPGISVSPRSASHPDQSAWYGSGTVAFAWDVPKGATAIRTGYDQSPASTPTQTRPLDTPEQVIDVADGIWYFHIQARDASGWGPVAHYKIQIDTSVVNPPVFDRFPALLTEGDVLLISGSAAKNSTVRLFLKGEGGYVHEQSTRTGDDGRFQAVWDDELDNGAYGLTADVTTTRGISSLRSPERPIMVQPGAFERTTKPVLDYAMIFVIVAGILFLCALWTWYLLHGFGRFRKKVRADVKRTSQLIHLEFKKVLERANKKRKLTEEEECMMEMIEKIEAEVEKDVKDIGR